ncbi:hypothetical protein ACM9XA_11400 [Xanthomonas sacchari]
MSDLASLLIVFLIAVAVAAAMSLAFRRVDPAHLRETFATLGEAHLFIANADKEGYDCFISRIGDHYEVRGYLRGSKPWGD